MSGERRARTVTARGVTFAALLCAAGAALGQPFAQPLTRPSAQPESVPPAIPHPALDGLEAPVATQLRLARRRLEASLEAGVAGEELGEVYGELGQLYHAYEMTDAAAASYRHALELDGADPRWRYLAALIAESRGELETAATLFEETLRLEPAAVPAKIRLALALHALGRSDEAAALLEQTLDAGDPASLAALGEVELARGNHPRAIELLETALSVEPRASRLHYPLAQALRAVGETERARAHLEAAGTVGLRPIDPMEQRLEALRVGETAHTLRGRRAFAAGQVDDARREFELAVAAAPGSPVARVNLAAALAAAGETDAARSQLETAIALDPERANAHYNLGRLQVFEGRWEDAVVSLRRALELDPDDVATRLALAEALRDGGRTSDALEELAALRRREPRVESAWLLAAQLLIDEGSWVSALELLEAGHRTLAGSARLGNGLARLLASAPRDELRDGARAVELAREAFATDERADHAETLALALAETGRCADARQWIAEAASRLAADDDARRRRYVELDRAWEAAVANGASCRP